MSDTQTDKLEPQTEEPDEATEAEQQPEADTEAEAAAEGEQAEQADTDPADDDGVVVTIGTEEAQADDELTPKNGVPLVPHLRTLLKQKDKELQKLKRAQAQAAQPVVPAIPELPPMPRMSDPDIDFNDDIHAERMAAWTLKKQEVEAAKARIAEEQAEQQRAWQAKMSGYEQGKKALALPDFDDAEEAVRGMFSVVQQSVLVKASADPAKLVYALGRVPSQAKELAKITDPIDFTAAVVRLESKGINVQKRTAAAPPPPERAIRGNSPGAAAVVDSQLERLREEAERTGDFSKVYKFKQQLKAKQK